jgi:DNA modification methylase
MNLVNGKFKRSTCDAIGRWAAVGPYYAMFPLDFAFDVVGKYSNEGELVLDPFAGRASSVFAAATQEREGFGIEINPVGWVYAQAKLNPAPQEDVEKRLKSLVNKSDEFFRQSEVLPKFLDQSKDVSEFFKVCYSKKVLTFLLTARDDLDWEHNQVDCTLMAILLIRLHGKPGEALSNQMRQTKAMAPNYSVRWWRERNLNPPEIDFYDFLLQKIRWRYAKGLPCVTPHSKVELGDSTQILPRIVELVKRDKHKKCSLLFTSPPYQGVTNYHDDQWLRLWLLRGPPKPRYVEVKHKGKFLAKKSYRELLESVFKSVSQIMSDESTIYVRTSAREFTFNTTIEILRKYFPSWKENIIPKPFGQKTQTHLFGDATKKPGEKDVIFTTR